MTKATHIRAIELVRPIAIARIEFVKSQIVIKRVLNVLFWSSAFGLSGSETSLKGWAARFTVCWNWASKSSWFYIMHGALVRRGLPKTVSKRTNPTDILYNLRAAFFSSLLTWDGRKRIDFIRSFRSPCLQFAWLDTLTKPVQMKRHKHDTSWRLQKA